MTAKCDALLRCVLVSQKIVLANHEDGCGVTIIGDPTQRLVKTPLCEPNHRLQKFVVASLDGVLFSVVPQTDVNSSRRERLMYTSPQPGAQFTTSVLWFYTKDIHVDDRL